MKYTHHNNELNLTHLNTPVYLKGWVQKARNLGGLIFIDLRDRFGITQLVVRPEQKDYATALKIRSEFVIEVQGTVIERESKNKHLPTGDIEIAVTELTVLSEAKTPPITVADVTDALEDTRLKYRYLDLRRPVMQNYLIKRHRITQAIRQYLVNEQFYELETPILGKSTPEGARDYLVPSRLYPGQFYALPQSPQIYKQLFMVSGFERYFQIAKCFRDEDLRSDRQPEFTQVDIEASFIEETDVYHWIEGLMQHLFKTVLNKEIKTPFERLTYETAVQTYGSDKPDLRFGLMFQNYQPLLSALEIPLFENKQYIKGFVLPEGAKLTRRQIDQYTDLVKKHHGEALVF
ncbi:MAG: aspartate--tRNA ligase, partial [Acholeplasmataceae bacterium]|nr:aspartate--tRNA ligase [Acholeplasmataceae bacterium]